MSAFAAISLVSDIVEQVQFLFPFRVLAMAYYVSSSFVLLSEIST